MSDLPNQIDAAAAKEVRRLIVTVHGIRTFGGWQEKLEELIYAEAKLKSLPVIVVNHKFNYFSIFSFIIPIFRWIAVRQFLAELTHHISLTNWTRVDIIGHSFGTYMIGWALKRMPEELNPRIHTVILAGSVLKEDFLWRDLLGTRLLRIINDCGARDNILLLSHFGVLGTGMAGRVGFKGGTSQVFRNRFSLFGHSGYFLTAGKLPSYDYMRRRWIPILFSDEPAEHFDEREAGAYEGIIAWLAPKAKPFKLLLYLAPILIALCLLSDLNEKVLKAKADRTRCSV